MAKAIGEKSKPIAERLGTAAAGDITLIVHPDPMALHLKTFGIAGAFLPDWYIRKNTKDHVLIISPESATPERSRKFIIDAGVHEYIHLVTDRLNKGMDLWLKEGFALYLAGQKPGHDNIPRLMDLSLGDFRAGNSLRSSRAGGYTLAYVLMEYLIEAYGWEGTIAFLEPEASFESVTGCGKGEFLIKWKAWMNERYGGIPAESLPKYAS